ncbi:MAG: hypothetical protein ABIR26_08600, partial [Ramlibacter sp.]
LPRSPGVVVGRDLASPMLEAAGHIGFFDGENVMQVMNEPEVVQKVSYANFASKSTLWAPVYTNIPNFGVTSCYEATCNFLDQWSTSDRVSLGTRMALVQRAYQIQLIGANYTIFGSSVSADPRMYDRNSRVYYPAIRGTYRCDTYVGDIFAFAYTPNGNYWVTPGSNLRIERVTSNVPASWNTKMQSLFNVPILPATFYNRFKAF